MLATFSDEARINRIVAAHKLPMSFVAALAGHAGIQRASQPTLTAGLGGRGLQRETSQPLLQLMVELHALTEMFQPVKIELKNAADVYGWLLLVRDGRLKVFSMDESELVERTLDVNKNRVDLPVTSRSNG